MSVLELLIAVKKKNLIIMTNVVTLVIACQGADQLYGAFGAVDAVMRNVCPQQNYNLYSSRQRRSFGRVTMNSNL